MTLILHSIAECAGKAHTASHNIMLIAPVFWEWRKILPLCAVSA